MKGNENSLRYYKKISSEPISGQSKPTGGCAILLFVFTGSPGASRRRQQLLHWMAWAGIVLLRLIMAYEMKLL